MASRREVPIKDQNIPPPSIEQVCKLQLIRTTLVKFIDWKDFDDVVRGCFVRVLLEMRAEDRTRDNADSYYVAVVKGAKKGPSYSGFSWDGISTEWHIIIELPPCFKSSPNGNLVQLSSISNTPFKATEYQQWVQMTRETGSGFITQGQITLRLQLLQEHYQQAVTSRKKARKAAQVAPEDANVSAQREAKIQQMKKECEARIRSSHLLLPLPDKLSAMKITELHEVERQSLDLLQVLRSAINERTKCRVCRNHVCSVVCYPCKHRVLCADCAKTTDICPAPQCKSKIQDKFEAFS